MAFFLTQESIYSWKFYFKANRKSLGSSKNGTRDFKNGLLFQRSAYFYVTITGGFEHYQYFNFVISFLKNENLFWTGV